MEKEIEGWVALRLVPGVEKVFFKRLMDHFGSFQAVFSTDEEQLRKVEGIGGKIAGEIHAFDWKWVLEREMTEFRKLDIRLVSLHDAGYPTF